MKRGRLIISLILLVTILAFTSNATDELEQQQPEHQNNIEEQQQQVIDEIRKIPLSENELLSLERIKQQYVEDAWRVKVFLETIESLDKLINIAERNGVHEFKPAVEKHLREKLAAGFIGFASGGEYTYYNPGGLLNNVVTALAGSPYSGGLLYNLFSGIFGDKPVPSSISQLGVTSTSAGNIQPSTAPVVGVTLAQVGTSIMATAPPQAYIASSGNEPITGINPGYGGQAGIIGHVNGPPIQATLASGLGGLPTASPSISSTVATAKAGDLIAGLNDVLNNLAASVLGLLSAGNPGPQTVGYGSKTIALLPNPTGSVGNGIAGTGSGSSISHVTIGPPLPTGGVPIPNPNAGIIGQPIGGFPFYPTGGSGQIPGFTSGGYFSGGSYFAGGTIAGNQGNPFARSGLLGKLLDGEQAVPAPEDIPEEQLETVLRFIVHQMYQQPSSPARKDVEQEELLGGLLGGLFGGHNGFLGGIFTSGFYGPPPPAPGPNGLPTLGFIQQPVNGVVNVVPQVTAVGVRSPGIPGVTFGNTVGPIVTGNPNGIDLIPTSHTVGLVSPTGVTWVNPPPAATVSGGKDILSEPARTEEQPTVVHIE